MRTLITTLVLAAMLAVGGEASAMPRGKFMVKAMDKFVGKPESLLIDKFGRAERTKKLEDGTTVNGWGVSCNMSVETKDQIVVRWSITGNWRGCWGYFLRLYEEKWLDQPDEPLPKPQ